MASPRPQRTSSLLASSASSTQQQQQPGSAPATSAAGRAKGDDDTKLTPVRAHYLKRQLVTHEFVREFGTLDSPDALSLLGPPFDPVPARVAATRPGGPTPAAAPATADLPFLKFVFRHFVLSFPFLANCPDDFFSRKVQPFFHSFIARNISTGEEALFAGSGGDPAEEDDDDDVPAQQLNKGERKERTTKRSKVAGKLEKHLGLVLSAAVRLAENAGHEEVVRVDDSGRLTNGLPASQQPPQLRRNMTDGIQPAVLSDHAQPETGTVKVPQADFDVNVVSVRIQSSGESSSSSSGSRFLGYGPRRRPLARVHEEFIVRTRRKGLPDIYVAHRYGDFARLADDLRKNCVEHNVRPPPAKDKRATAAFDTAATAEASSSSASPSSSSTSVNQGSTSIPRLARERNRLTLRAYLRTLLNNEALASQDAFRDFLIAKPIQLSKAELDDVRAREDMDRLREQERARFKGEIESRVAELERALRSFREDMVKRDGLTRVFATIRHTENFKDLPEQYRKVFEWGRISLASTLYSLFLGSDNSSESFSQLKRIHGLMPYFMIRQILRISNPVAMIRAMLDLFLAKPFGSRTGSLLQRMFSSGIQDEARELREDAALVERKIANQAMCDKVRRYVDAPRETQLAYRREAASEGLDIMTVILRSAEEPALGRDDMMRVQRATVAYAEYKHYRDELSDPDDDEGPDNDDAWLFEDLHVLRRLITRARDKEQMVELIFEGTTGELLKDIVTIFYEPLANVYKAANIADSLYDLQVFVNDLIKTVEQAEEANLLDPHKTVQTFVDLVARHEERFYHFVHSVHSKGEGLFDSLMRWIERFINFVRDGLPQPIALEFLLPHGGQERANVLAEVDEIVNYHRKLKLAHHERMRRRLVKGEASDRDADVEFVNEVMNNLNITNVMGDVSEMQQEESDDEDDDASESSSYEDALAEQERQQGNNGLLERIPDERGEKRRRRKDAPIEPPRLALIPQMVPVFVEMVRDQLEHVS